MKIILYNNEKTFRILNELISSGYYKGSISPNRFDFRRENFPNNTKVVGKLNQENQFKIASSYVWPINVLAPILTVCGILLCLVQLIYGNWFVSLLLLVSLVSLVVVSYFRGRKESKLFLDRFFKFERRIDNKK